jgi:hypothetical protein
MSLGVPLILSYLGCGFYILYSERGSARGRNFAVAPPIAREARGGMRGRAAKPRLPLFIGSPLLLYQSADSLTLSGIPKSAGP